MLKIRKSKKVYFIQIRCVLLAEAMDHYIRIHCERGNKVVPHLYRNTLCNLKKKLFHPQFEQVSRSHIIDATKMEYYDEEDNCFVTTNNHRIQLFRKLSTDNLLDDDDYGDEDLK